MILLGGVLASACVIRATDPTPNYPPLTYTTAHFVFHHHEADRPTIATTAAAIEAEYDRVIADLGAGSMPKVHVSFHEDHASLQSAVRAVAGQIPSWASGLVIGVDQIHMMSFAQATWGPYERRLTDLVHEFAHAVSIRISPSIANRPRWLWESVAIYEAGQFVDPRLLPYLVSHQPPPFTELNTFDSMRIYEVGYLIAEFIVSRGGRAAMRSLIINLGDTVATLGLTQAEFEAAWFAYARERYGF